MNDITRSILRTIQISISDKELQKICELIYLRAGIVLTSQKKDMVQNRLSRRLRTLGIISYSEYIQRLEENPNSDEWQAFINALTTNLTSFFRESYHFPILLEHARKSRGGYNVWCSAASTGEEPLSIAMTLNEALGRNPATGPRVWATDIDTDVLQKARNGIYQLSDLNGLTLKQKEDYFLRRSSPTGDLVKVKKDLLLDICYQQLNLLAQNWDIPAPFDAIFCRNVMIYFDQKTQEQLMRRFAKMLKPDGIVFVGHSEHFGNMAGPFRLRGQSVYSLDKEISWGK